MFSSPTDTLTYQMTARPGTMRRSLRGIPCSRVASEVGNYVSGHPDLVAPEADALRFYLLNHAAAEVARRKMPDEPLGTLLVVINQYHEALAEMALRMAYYLLLVCTRENRHLNMTPNLIDKLSSIYAGSKTTSEVSVAIKFIRSLAGSSSCSALKKLMGEPPGCSLGVYVDLLRDVFYYGDWSSSYGGKSWAGVADYIRWFVSGDISAETMLDGAYALAHNNGPIFNKGIIYANYVNGAKDLYRILDVQRSGQIPQLIFSDAAPGWTGSAPVVSEYKTCSKVLGSCFEGPVNWLEVEAVDKDVSAYDEEKSAQLAAEDKVAGDTGDHVSFTMPEHAGTLKDVAVKKISTEREITK